MKKISDSEVKKRFFSALGTLKAKDAFLLENNVHERSIAHRLAVYLEEGFFGYDVDVEYNRHGIEIKKQSGPRRVFPDIIVHKRGDNDNNILVIELKTQNRNNKKDLEKLREFTKKNGEYAYKLGVFVRLVSGNQETLWFKDGRVIQKLEI